ncbi:MAG: NADPH-dependent F420 reductase [Methanomicrobiales archaeon]|nr:NADPH-dependent F420 reductase [Methanoregulaceae archaeon]MCC7467577.1 NADPH-dependent F420 reductase [Burkholderiaceae bacterium]NLH25421.1 NADPH-dependent F420 reductase [Methanomicrobiales archaeon]HNB03261.1 NADPH-dependent F420 reductase [Methanoregulaceae archaeon]HNI42281.1 NADPH-dependent F420 reductase [Methanoregulaceae archaeon]
MKIGIVGGTGDIGEGIAMRLSPNHNVVIGSREEEKAVESSDVCYATVTKLGLPCSVSGYSNQEAIDRSDIIILAIPFRHVEPTLASLHGFENKLVISPVNPMEKRDFFVYTPPPDGSAALLIKRLLPKETRLCSAFNTVAANKWKALNETLDLAVPVCGDDSLSKATVLDLVRSIPGVKAYDAGPLAVSSMVECLTPLLLNIARFNKMKDVGVQFR